MAKQILGLVVGLGALIISLNLPIADVEYAIGKAQARLDLMRGVRKGKLCISEGGPGEFQKLLRAELVPCQVSL